MTYKCVHQTRDIYDVFRDMEPVGDFGISREELYSQLEKFKGSAAELACVESGPKGKTERAKYMESMFREFKKQISMERGLNA